MFRLAEFMDVACESVPTDGCYESNRQCAGNDENSALLKLLEKRPLNKILLTDNYDRESLQEKNETNVKDYKAQNPGKSC